MSKVHAKGLSVDDMRKLRDKAYGFFPPSLPIRTLHPRDIIYFYSYSYSAGNNSCSKCGNNNFTIQRTFCNLVEKIICTNCGNIEDEWK